MSLKKIAEQVGVSAATVSRVLNNPNYHPSEPGLREKIWQVAMEINYSPNVAARNLKKGVNVEENRTYYINVLMTRMDESRTDPFFSELLRVIETEVHRNSCILSKVWYKPMFSDDRACERTNLEQIIGEMYNEVENRRDGLIIIGKCNAGALKKLNRIYKGVVSVNRNSTNYEVDEVLCDGQKVAATAVQHLIDLGHKKIGYVGECANEARYRGFEKTLSNNKIEINSDYIIETRQTEADGYEAMEKMFSGGKLPTGIYCANDITAIGMLKSLEKHKNLLFKPSVIASDDIEQAQFCKPMLTTVSLPKEEMGHFAMYLLMDRLRGGHKRVVRMELEGKLMIRNSTFEC